MWVKFIRKGVLLLAILVVAALLLQELLHVGFRRGSFYKQQWVHQLAGREDGIVIVGSSRALVTVDAQLLGEQTGMEVVNLALDGSRLLDHLALLKMYLRDNRCEVVLFEVDHWTLEGAGNADDSYRFFHPFLGTHDLDRLFKRNLGRAALGCRLRNRIPLLTYASLNRYWSLDKWADGFYPLSDPPFDRWGSYLQDRSFGDNPDVLVQVGERLDPDVPLLEEARSLCSEHGVRLVLFTAPWFRSEDKGGWEEAIMLLRDRGFEVRDFSRLFNGKETHFYDAAHLNQRGAVEFTPRLAELIGPGHRK